MGFLNKAFKIARMNPVGPLGALGPVSSLLLGRRRPQTPPSTQGSGGIVAGQGLATAPGQQRGLFGAAVQQMNQRAAPLMPPAAPVEGALANGMKLPIRPAQPKMAPPMAPPAGFAGPYKTGGLMGRGGGGVGMPGWNPMGQGGAAAAMMEMIRRGRR